MPLPTPTLTTTRLRLRPFADTDADALFALMSDPRVTRYWDAPPWRDRARVARFIAACRQMEQDGTGARVVLERIDDGAFIGWCGLFEWNPDHRSAALGYCLAENAWGHGYATEAAGALLQWAFDTLDLNRVQSETDTRNLASARVLEKLGFLREGTTREDCVVEGEVSDTWVYGLLRRQWRPPSRTSADVAPGGLTIVATDAPSDVWMHAVDAGLDEHNFAVAPLLGVTPLAAFATTAEGVVAGGAVGRTWGRCCELLQLWVEPGRRGTGVGSRLLDAFEARGRARGCDTFYLTTLSYQAPDFYRRHGYHELARIDGYPDGIVKFLMHKRDD